MSEEFRRRQLWFSGIHGQFPGSGRFQGLRGTRGRFITRRNWSHLEHFPRHVEPFSHVPFQPFNPFIRPDIFRQRPPRYQQCVANRHGSNFQGPRHFINFRGAYRPRYSHEQPNPFIQPLIINNTSNSSATESSQSSFDDRNPFSYGNFYGPFCHYQGRPPDQSGYDPNISFLPFPVGQPPQTQNVPTIKSIPPLMNTDNDQEPFMEATPITCDMIPLPPTTPPPRPPSPTMENIGDSTVTGVPNVNIASSNSFLPLPNLNVLNGSSEVGNVMTSPTTIAKKAEEIGNEASRSAWLDTFRWRFANQKSLFHGVAVDQKYSSSGDGAQLANNDPRLGSFDGISVEKDPESNSHPSNETRHGRVQSVKLLSEENSGNINGGGSRPIKSATVAFIDIRSASKALRNVRSIAGQPIHINYHEPGSVPSRGPPPPLESSHPGEPLTNSPDTPVTPSHGNAIPVVGGGGTGVNNNCIPGSPAAGMYRQQRFTGQHGQSEDASSHFYDQPKSFSRGRGDGHGFHTGRGRRDTRPPFHNRHSFPADSRNFRPQWGYSNERYAPPAHSEVDDRASVPPSTTHPPISESSSKGSRRPESPASSISSRHVPNTRHRSRSVSESGSSDHGSAGSRSRSGSRSSVSTSASSGRSKSPPHHGTTGHYSRGGSTAGRFHQNSYARQRYSRSRLVNRSSDSRVRHSSRSPMAASPSSSTSSSPSPHRKIAAPHSPSHSPSSSKSYSPSRNMGVTHHHHHSHHHNHRRTPNTAELHAAIKIRNLPLRSSDTSLKDGLYHEYKKHGKVAWVRVIGSSAERYAIVCFKSPEHAARAVSLSQDKLFFGCKIQVAPFHHGKNDELIGAPEEENRVTEEEPTSVGYPTRTVLVTGLDCAVTNAELKSAFDQYGDIVQIDIRKQGTATHAVCEFVDIASSIRAQWGRHVFKSKEARISFYRNPPSHSLLLDGTAGVTDKQVFGHCCQYGAIKRIVMDSERFLALVQFEEISSAQTAIRQLRSWVIKGKHLQVDFASTEVTRRFLERMTTSLASNPESSSPSSQVVGSPSIGNSFGLSLKEGGTQLRRIRSKIDEDDLSYSQRRASEFDGLRPGKGRASENMQDQGSVTSFNGGSTIDVLTLSTTDSDTFPQYKDIAYRLRTGYTSPVSPDAEHSQLVTERQVHGVENPGRSNTRSKIDLSCHETDSAIVTSSSDVIVGEKSELHTSHGSSSSSVNGDEKLGSLEMGGRRRKSLSSDISRTAIVTVDGVSSTSPEPKTETVRKASPDPGIGVIESASRYSGDIHMVLGDPRKKHTDAKIRRSSADSGNSSNIIISSPMHSTTGAPSSYCSLAQLQASTTVVNPIVDGNESDDRPGTPLCDENPECFPASDISNSFKVCRVQPFSLSVRNDPISLPLPEFALHRQRANSNTSCNEFPSSSVRLSRSSSETNLKSPIKSPISSENNESSFSGVTDIPTSGENNASLLTSVVEPPFSTSTNASWKQNSVSTNIRRNSKNYGDAHSEDPQFSRNLSALSEIEKAGNKNVAHSHSKDHHDGTIARYSDSDAGSSPRTSPTSVSLEQRIQKCCERYDRWNGSRTNLNLNTGAQSNNVLPISSSTEDALNHGIDEKKAPSPECTDSNSSYRFPLTKHKFLDLDELRHQPSDIGKSVLARRSVFDEDTKRLENFGEKYEAKSSSTSTTGSSWRVLALQRSASTSSTVSGSSGSNSCSWQTPSSPVTPVTPPSAGVLTPSLPFSNTSVRAPTSSTLTPVSNFNAMKSLLPQVGIQSPSICTQSKPKDLNHTFGTIPKPLKLDVVGRSQSQPTPNAQTPPYCRNSLQLSSIVSVKPSAENSKSPSSTSSLKFPDGRDQLKPMSSPKPGSGIMSSQNPQQMHSMNSSSVSSSLVGHTIATQPLVHQGLPRAVERSLSLDSKKNNLTGNGWNVIGTGISPQNTAIGSSNVLSGTSGPSSISPSVTIAGRRSSVDSNSSIAQSNSSEGGTRDSPAGNKSLEQTLQPTTKRIRELIATNVMDGLNFKPSDKSSKISSSCDSLITGEKNLRLCPPPIPNDSSSLKEFRKSEIDLISEEIMEMHPIQQETTVAVVATEQNPFLPSRNDSVGSSSTREPSKKDKDKKSRSSGTSTPVTSLNSTATYLNAVGIESPPNQQCSSREKMSSGKGSEDKKEKKEKESKSGGDSVPKQDDHQKLENSTPQKKNDEKRDKKEKKDAGKEKDSGEHSSSSWKDSNNQLGIRKDKESSGKRKRHPSSQDVDQDQKKAKLEKEVRENTTPNEITHHHRLKSTSSNERRESRDSSCSSKEKVKDKESIRIPSISQNPEVSSSREKDKEESKSKEYHHRSKDRPSGSSKDKHQQHHTEKSRTPSESRPNHQSGKVEHSSGKEKEKERQKKDKVSPGKENLKGASKHNNHGSSHHSGSSSRSKESSGTVKNKSGKERSKSQGDKHYNAVDSESEGAPSSSLTNAGSVEISLRAESHSSGYERGKSEKQEKRDSSGKRDRHKSGSENPAGSGGSDRSKNKEHKKQKKFVIDDSESSDTDDDEKKKHHSIFEVVIDEYVSMYDKVKARNNRACKSNSQQQQDELKKHDKIKDQFRQLKQSRAKKVDKKRSTSVDESNKSGIHTSSDESSQMDISVAEIIDEDNHRIRDADKEPENVREHDLTQSSEDEESRMESNSKSKSSRKSKSKKSSSSGEKSSSKRGRKSNKSSPSGATLFQMSASSVFSNSDYESNASSSQIQEPERKKKRMIIKSTSTKDKIPMSADTKSSEESMSESDNHGRRKRLSKSKLQNLESASETLPKKLQATDIYSDSDSSVESGPVRSISKSIALPTSVKTKNKEKLSKQKSMRKSLFESSDSSDAEGKINASVHITRKEKNRESNVKPREKEKDNKGNRKKHRGHSSSRVAGSKSGKSSRKQRVSSGDGSFDLSSQGLSKRESGSTMEDILFGPMTSSSSSETEGKHVEDLERPKTPTVSVDTAKAYEEAMALSRRSKSRRSNERKVSRSLSPSSSVELGSDGADLNKLVVAVPKPVTSSSERKKKRHHKEKRSKRGEGEDHNTSKSPKSGGSDVVKPVDFDSLFNSPKRSTVLDGEYKSKSPVPFSNVESSFNISNTVSSLFSMEAPKVDPKSSLHIMQSSDKERILVINETTKVIQQSGMFSSDDDDDDDKLKIDINEAIIASSEDPTVGSSVDVVEDSKIKDKQKREEEEKKLHSLFEQDMAIESIVLLERKSPPPLSSVADEEVIKDEIPKDCTAISQEETEDAVAALLETLEGDDDADDGNTTGPGLVKPPGVSSIPVTIHSPPTIRIIEDPVVSSETSSTVANLISSNIQACIDRVAKTDSEPVSAWTCENEVKSHSASGLESTKSEDSGKLDIGLPKTPDIQSRKVSVDSNNSSVDDRNGETKTPAKRGSGKAKSRQGSIDMEGISSADVYEFHDSDEEKNSRRTQLIHARHTPPVPASVTKSPLSSPSLPSPVVSVSPTDVDTKPSLPSNIVSPSSIGPSIVPTSLQPQAIQVPQFGGLSQVPKSGTPVLGELFSIAKLANSTPVASTLIPRSKTPPTSTVAVVRNTVDETIEHVIRMSVMSQISDTIPDTSPPALTITSVKTGGARARSLSKDTVTEDSTVSITKVMSRPDASPRSSAFQPPPSSANQIDVLQTTAIKLEKDITAPGKEGENETTGLETLIDPQTGILMPMMRQSDEGQYVPIVGQDNSNMLKLQMPHIPFTAFQIRPDDMIVKAGEREAVRPVQQPHTPAPNLKNEGLAAMFSQQHVLHQVSMQHNPSSVPTSALAKGLPPQRHTAVPSQGQTVTSNQGGGFKNTAAVYTTPGVFHSMKGIGSAISPGTLGQPAGPLVPVTSQPSINETIAVSHTGSLVLNPGTVSAVRPAFPCSQPSSNLTPQSHYQFAVISRPIDGMSPRPALRQIAIPSSQPSLNINKPVLQTSSGHPPSELVNFQIPSATTITKVNSGLDELAQRKPAAIQPPLGVVVSSSLTSIGTTGPNSTTMRGLVASPNSSMSMTHQQHQQHQAQTEMFRRSVEGPIRFTGREDNIHSGRIQEAVGLAQPPRIDITGSIAQAAAASPKAGRVPMMKEQLPPVSTQSRIQPHSLPYESSMGEIRVVPPHLRQSADPALYGPLQHQQILYPSHFGPGGVGGPSTTNSLPPTSTFSLRSGLIDKSHHPDLKSLSSDLKTVSVLGMDRERIIQNLPQHSLPHSTDQRNTESPMLTPMYGVQRHVYQTQTSTHPPLSRQTFTNPYAELVERERQHSQSPSYTTAFDNRNLTAAVVAVAASEREPLRVTSPYSTSSVGLPKRAYSPPPAHIRYGGTHPLPAAEAPASIDRIRQLQVQTPPHASQVPPQGDSLLMLLQRYPIMWQGLLALKNDNAACQMHFVSGNLGVARDSLPTNPDGTMPPLRISQRMRLEQTQLEGVARKIQMDAEHCMLLALPCGRDHMDVLQQSNNLRTGFITYLQLKQAAGIVNICHPITQQPAYVIHIFPSCDFANENLARIAPDLLHGVADIAHLLIVIATV